MDPPSPESYYALRWSSGLSVRTRAEDMTARYGKEDRRALDALTIVASTCVSTAAVSYAASFFTFIGGSSPQTKVMFSGGSQGVPAAVKSFLQESLLPKLRAISRSSTMPLDEASLAVFHAMLVFGFEYWWNHVSMVPLDKWDEAVARIPSFSYNRARASLDEIKVQLSELWETCGQVNGRTICSDDVLRIHALLNSINNKLGTEAQLAFVGRDWEIGATGWFDKMLDSKHIGPLDGSGIVDDQGQLIADFSCTRHIANIIAPEVQAFRLAWLVQKRPDIFSDIDIVFCEPTLLVAPLDPERASHTCFKQSAFVPVTSESHVRGHLHAPMNVLQHLLPLTSSPNVLVFPAIGCSRMLCQGCYDYLCAVNAVAPRFPWKEAFAFSGTTGKVVFPWLSPNFSTTADWQSELQKECCLNAVSGLDRLTI